jgi:hypothetical protein
MAIGVLVAVSMPFQQFDVNRSWGPSRVLYQAPWFVLFGFVFVLAIALAEASASRLRPSTGRYALAAIAAGVVCIALSGLFALQMQRAPSRTQDGRLDPPPKGIRWETNQRYMGIAGLGLDSALYGSLAMFIYVRLRNARLAAQALADAEVRRSEEQRILLAAQLFAAQARVDPAFVLKALDEIEEAYAVDPARGNLLLDDFIAFLRDAIPRLRSEETEAGKTR